MKEPVFAELMDRIKAVFTDMIVYVIFIFLVSNAFASIENVSTTARIIAFVCIFGIYDPLFTSLFGGTIGHLINGLRVKKAENLDNKIIFPIAVIRFIFKTLLGSVSLLTVTSNNKNQAIHDLVAKSVVIRKN